MMKCLVIGGAGFLGSYITRLLVESGRNVVVLDHRLNPPSEFPSKVDFVTGDLNDRSLLQKNLRNINEVIDLAYSSIPKTSFEDPLNDILSNLPTGVMLLQEATRISGLRKLVLVSSGGTVYGKADLLPIEETHSTNPISPYGITKLTMEKYAGMYMLIAGLPVAIARPANAYGEGQLPFTGQGFIATAIQSILQGKIIDIFGRQGTIRDYIHASDIASGILAILEYGGLGEAYNIGSGIGRNNLEVLECIKPLAKQSGLEIKINILPERSFDVPINILSSLKLTKISGWHPDILFDEGIQRVWNSSLFNYVETGMGEK